jgi:ferric-dicitrate binding protein FerR (iron transport regulator)
MNSDGDTDLASLLRAAGVRVKGPEQMSADVRAAVEAEWQATRAARQQQRRRIAWTTAIVIACAALGAWFARPLYVRSDAPLASLSLLGGTAEYRHHGDDGWTRLAASVVLRSGDDVRTGSAGRVALKLTSGVEMRLASATRIELEDLRDAELRRGAIYVNSAVPMPDDARKLRLTTPAGIVRHLGAQFEARVVGDAVRISVRTGRVSVALRDGDAIGTAGEQITIEDNHVARNALAANSAIWAWVGP